MGFIGFIRSHLKLVFEYIPIALGIGALIFGFAGGCIGGDSGELAETIAVSAPATTTVTPTTTTPTTTTPTTTTPTTIPAAVIAEQAVLTDAYAWGYSDKTEVLQQILGLPVDGYYGAGTRLAHVAVLNQRGLSVAGVPEPPTTTTTTPTTVTPTTTTTTPQTYRPGPIYGVNGVGGDRQVTLSWNTPDDGGSPLTGFVIQMAAAYAWTWFPYPCPPNGSPDAPSVEGGYWLGYGSYWLFTPWANSITLADCASIGSGGTYEFRVAAVNANGPANGWGSSTPRIMTYP